MTINQYNAFFKMFYPMAPRISMIKTVSQFGVAGGIAGIAAGAMIGASISFFAAKKERQFSKSEYSSQTFKK